MTGKIFHNELCSACQGTGKEIYWDESYGESPPVGVITDEPCPICKGRGAIEIEDEYDSDTR